MRAHARKRDGGHFQNRKPAPALLPPYHDRSEVGRVVDADCKRGTPIGPNQAVKPNVADEATGIDDPGVILLLDEARCRLSASFRKRGCWIEHAPVGRALR